jgi:hypothetical protein
MRDESQMLLIDEGGTSKGIFATYFTFYQPTYHPRCALPWPMKDRSRQPWAKSLLPALREYGQEPIGTFALIFTCAA